MNRRNFLTLLGAAGITVALPPVIGSSKWLEELMPTPIKTALGESGWQRLPNGTLIQWGTLPRGGAIQFPISFANSGVTVQIQSHQEAAAMLEEVTNTGFAARHDGPLMWVAVGR